MPAKHSDFLSKFERNAGLLINHQPSKILDFRPLTNKSSIT
ncbi:MAG TPA: hypothetical protein VK184_17710 [Nostocaceae cyanobacterium]|nr:hypothetical protein [Nostocaceae cyanobacterium]